MQNKNNEDVRIVLKWIVVSWVIAALIGAALGVAVFTLATTGLCGG